MVRGVLVLLAALFVMAQPAHAIGIDLSTIPAVKEYPLASEAGLKKLTKRVTEAEPYGDGLLAYELYIPRNWTDNTQQPLPGGIGTEAKERKIGSSVLGIVGKFISAPKNLLRSHIQIEAQEMSYEISAQNWFVNFILNNGFTLSSLTEISPKELVAMYVQVEGDQTYVVRVRVLFNGSRLVMVRYYLPQENYEEDKVLQAQILSTFKLLNPTSENIEKQETYGFLDQSYFNYPVSWTLKEKSILSIERMSALLYQERKEDKKIILEGHIKINVISKLLKTTLAQEIQAFRDNLKIKSYTIGDLIGEIKYDYDPSIKSGRTQAYKLVPDDPVHLQSYEFIVTVLEGDDYYYITSMITPAREQDFYTWAQNIEAARIVNESIRRFNIPKVDPNDPYYDYLKEVE